MAQHRIFSNTIINIVNTFISFVIAYAMTPVILGRMGSEAYGLWVFLGIFSITGYFSLLDFGLQGAAIKYVAEYKAKNDRESLQAVTSVTLSFFLGIGLLSGLMLFLFNTFFFSRVFQIPGSELPLISLLVNILAISFIFQFPAIAFSAFIEGLQRYDYLRGVTIITTIISNLIIFLFLKNAGSLNFMVAVSVGTSIVITLLYALIARKLMPEIRLFTLKIKKAAIKTLFNFSAKLFASKIVGLIFNNTQKILIGIFLAVIYQTQFDIVNKLHIILLSILSVFNQAVLPATAEFEAKNDNNILQKLLIRSTKYASAALLPAFLIIMIFARNLLSIWVGPDYAFLAPLVQLYISHFVVTMLVGVSSTMLVGVNKVGKVLKISLWAAVLNLVISLATVKIMGISGLILGTVVAYIVSSFIYIFAANRIFLIKNKDFFINTIGRLLPASAISTLILLSVKLSLNISHLWSLFSVAVGVYGLFFVTLYFTGLSQEEKLLAKYYINRITGKFIKKIHI